MQRYLPLTVVALLGLGACTNTSGLAPAPPFPTPVRAEALPPYYIQVGDTLDIRLILNPELNDEVVVRPDGHISTTAVPDEVAAGRTVAELDTALRKDYSHVLTNPSVSLLLKSSSPERFYVGGEVPTPGEFVSSTGPLSLSQALARAGGVKYSADINDIFIIRRAGGGTPSLLSVRYSDVAHAKDATADVLLAPNDVVYVPRSGIAEVYAVYNQYIEQFAHPSFGFDYVVGGNGNNNVITSTPAVTTTTH
jgi:polysaccharide export outer membrane protein